MAAEGIVDGTYQLVDLTHASGYLWIRVTAGDKLYGGGHQTRGGGAGILHNQNAAQRGGGVADGISPRRVPARRPGLEAG